MNSINQRKNLCIAIRLKDVEKIKNIISKNQKIVNRPHSSRDLPQGMRTPLWEAIFCGHKKIVELLVDLGADPDERYSTDEDDKLNNLTFLQCLALQGDFWQWGKKIAKVLIKRGADVNAYDGELKTPLQLAIEQGNIQCTEFLLKYAVYTNVKLFEGPEWQQVDYHPLDLILSAPKSKQKELLKLLFEYGLNPGASFNCESGLNFLHIVIRLAFGPDMSVKPIDTDHFLEIAKIILDSGLPIDELDDGGRTALYWAAAVKNIKSMAFLIDEGADVNKKTIDGGFFSLFVMSTHNNNVDEFEVLISKGADINAKTYFGQTVLSEVCECRCNHEVIEFLIQKGANVSVEDAAGDSPFSFLEPQKYNENDVSSINVMVRGIAKQKFFGDLNVCQQDIDLLQAHPAVEELYQNCLQELSLMLKTKFFSSYSYHSVMKMSKYDINRLAKLTKNKNFLNKFTQNLEIFINYYDELQRILMEAIEVKDNLEIVYSRLVSIFGDFFPTVILRILANNFKVEDLPFN